MRYEQLTDDEHIAAEFKAHYILLQLHTLTRSLTHTHTSETRQLRKERAEKKAPATIHVFKEATFNVALYSW